MIDKLQHFITVVFRDIPTSFLVGFLVLYCVGTVLFLVCQGWRMGARWSAGLLLVEYMVLLFTLAVLARNIHPTRPFDFTPFWSYRAAMDGRTDLLTQNIANILAFIPIGFLLGCAFGRMKWWKALLIGGGFSVLIEVLQFAFRLGFAEFDDVFHNVLGCMIGYGVYMGITWGVRNVASKRVDGEGAAKVAHFNP